MATPCVCCCQPTAPLPAQAQITTLQEELAAARDDNMALKTQLEAAVRTAAATQLENDRLRGEAKRLR